MLNDKLLKNLGRLGLPLMEMSPDFDVNETLVEVITSGETRLWEGFPVLLANAAQEYSFKLNQVLDRLKSEDEREKLNGLLALSLALYQHYHLSFFWANDIKKKLPKDYVAKLKVLRNALAHDDFLPLWNKRFHASRLKEVFTNYFKQSAEKSRQLKEKHEELSLEYALSQLFSPKQKELFQKKLKGEPLNKTEKEYYSRTVKKKVSALANPELHRLSQKLMDY